MTWREYNIKSSDVTAWLAHLQSQDDGNRLGSCFQPAPRSANLEAPDSVKSRNTSMKPSSPRPFMIWKKCLKTVFSSLLKATILHQCNNYWLLTESKSSTAHPSGLVQLHANPRRGPKKRWGWGKCCQTKYCNRLLQKALVGELSTLGVQ